MASSDTNVNVAITATTDELASGMQRGVGIVEGSTKEIESSFSSMAEGIKEHLGEIAGAIGIAFSVEALKEFAAKAFETSEQVDHLSQSLGVSTQFIQTMSYAAGLTGGSLDTASSAMTRLERAAVEAAQGNEKIADTFKSLGVSVTDAAGHIKPAEQLLQDTTKALAGFENGAVKTADVIQLMGRGAAQNIPFINELGEHFDELKQHAEELGIVLSDTDQKALSAAQEGFNELGQQAKGLANQFAIALLPAIHGIRDAFSDSLTDGTARIFFEEIANGAKVVVLALVTVREAVKVVTDTIAAMYDVAVASFSATGDYIGAFAQLVRDELKFAFTLDFTSYAAATQNFINETTKTTSEFVTRIGIAQQALGSGFSNSVDAVKKTFDTLFVSANNAADGVENVHKKTLQLPSDFKSASEEANRLVAELVKWEEEGDRLTGKVGGAYTQAIEQFNETMLKSAQELVVMEGDGLSAADAFEMLMQKTDQATAAMWNSIAADVVKNDKANDYLQKLKDELGALQSLTNEQKAAAEFDKIAAENAITLHDAYGVLHDTQQEVIDANAQLKDGFVADATAIKAHIEAVKNDQAVIKEWQSIATNAFDSAFTAINKDIVEGGSVMKDLVNVAKQVVEAILLQFEKLAIINPLMNAIFGTSAGGSLLPTLGNSGGLLGSLFGGGGALASSGAIPGGGAYTLAPVGASSAYAGIGSSFGYGGGLGAAAGALGGAYAGYNEFNAAGGGIAGLAGGAAYGIGTFALGGAVTAGISAAAAGSISAGMAAGFAAIPVVGWIGLAAMGLNAITGGGLFGTSWKPFGTEENLTVGEGGASITAAIDEKKKKALFGGTAWKNVSTPVDQATQDSVAAFFTGLQNAATAEAKAFGESTANIVTGSFHETFDKAGKMLTQTSTVLGQTYSESIQDFQNRVLAETLAAQIPASAGAEAIANQWRSSASNLLAGVEFLAQAQLDITQGHALVQSETLADLTKFVQGMAQQGEALLQTYARLSQETSVVQGILTNLGLDTGKTGEALVKFDDDMVNAAGGLQNLTSAWQAYYSEYYSQSEQQANALRGLQQSVTTQFALIGEDPAESMAKFRQDFETALPSLAPEQVVQWLAAADALAKLNQAMGTTTQQADAGTQAQVAAQSKYDGFIAGFVNIISPMTQFEAAISGVHKSLTDSISQANQLAIAAGKSGASIDDLTSIIQASAIQGAAALQTLESDAQSLAGKLFGTSLDALKANLAAAQGKAADNGPFQYYWTQQANQLQGQVDAAEAQQQAAQHLQDATALLQDLGQIGTVSGQSLQDLATQLGIPLDKLAQYLGTDQTGVQKQFEQIEATARAAIDTAGNTKYTNELLADILAQYKGEALPFAGNPIQTAITGVSPAAGGKIGGPITVGPPAHTDVVATQQPTVDAINTNTSQSNSDMSTNNRLLGEQNDLLRQLVQKIGMGGTSIGPRSIRTGVLIP